MSSSSPSPSTPTSEKPGNHNAGILGGAASSRFASSSSSPSSHSHSIPIQHSYSNTSSTHSRPSSPSTTTRTSSPPFNRRSNSSSSATIGGVGVGSPSSSSSNSVHNPLRYSNNHSSPTTPQRQHSNSGGGIRRALTPSSSSVHSPTTAGSPSSSRNPEAALTSLQELIRTMPSASSESGHNSPNARSSPVTATTGSTPSLPRLRSTSSTAGTGSNVNMNTASSSSSTTTTSTLNPNAGGFQPGALSALGEVEHEVLITPQVATFGPGISSPIVQGGGNGRHPQSPMHGQAGGGNGGGIQHAGGPFSSATAAGNNNNTTGGISNVFGSPIQTPSSQANHNHANHNPYMNTPEWQNFHNVFNAGIGNNNNTNTAGSPPPTSHASNVAGGAGVLNNGNNMSPMSPSNNGIDFNTILASMQGGNNNNMGQFMDFNALGGAGGGMNAAQAALAAAMAGGGGNGGNMNPMNNPFQAQLAMLQQMQQASNNNNNSNQGYNGGNGNNNANAQQAALLQQAQQMQLALMLQAQQQQQAQAQAQASVQNQGIAPRFNNNNASAASNSQPDLASIAAGLSTAGNNSNVGGAPFMAEQMALQAQYEALRLQQQELMNRFQEMQLQAVQLAQAQAQMGSPQQQQQQQVHVQQSHSPAHSHHGSTTTTTGNHGIGSPLGAQGQAQAQLHHHHSRDASIQQQQQNNQGGPPVSGTGRQPHRRGASQSISGMASSGPMGQFGSMGQFALPSQASSGTNTTAAGGGGVGLPKGHGRRHSVNVNAAKRNENNNNNIMAFSFPAGAANPTQGGTTGGGGAQVADQLGATNATAGHEQQEEVPGQQRAARAYGHGRRESRGSIGSLAGWGSNSNVVTQSSVPITQPTVTDLAQAQSQLLQLSQFRASAGHSRIPSFGIQQLQGGPGGNQQRKSLFAPYLPAASIPPLLQTGKLVIGVLRVNKRNRSDAYVATDVLDADVFICGSKDRNRALEGDVVAVELLDVDEVWGTKKEKEEKKRKKEESTSFDPKFQQALRKQDKKRDDVEVEGQGLTLFDDEEVNDDSKPTYAGHVIAVVERQAGQLFAGTLGILRPSSAATKEKQDAERRERDGIDIRGGDEQRNRPKIVWFKPVDKRVPLVAIPADQAPSGFLDRPDDYVNTLFVACIKRWPITSLHPFGSLVEELGEIGNLEAESNALLKDCGFTDETFSDNVAKCLPPTPWNIPQTEIDARKDFRQCRVFTIDPDTARDLDDALHINKLDDGTFEVGVHIADVSHFVKPNTALDREARRRGTTVYLVQRASPMLPESLSSDLCSLQPGEDRLAFSSVFKMSADGRVLSSWFGKSVIKSAAKLSYNMAQQAIDEGKLPENLTIHDDHDMEGIVNDIKQLDNMAKQMRARRFENGALRIDNVKLSFALDDEGRPIDCVVYERKDSHSLIEEFMLTANQAVAQKIASALPEQALLRRHEMPIARRLEGFTKRAGKLGYDFDITSAGSLMKSFKSLSKDDPELVLRLLATKAMLKASYICSGMFDIAKYHHYALNIPIYTHFTSPIRRYADVIVHRQLEAALTENPEGRFLMDPEAVSKVAQHCNTKKGAAKLAQEASQHLYLCTMVSDLTQKYGPVMRQATVIGVLDQAFDVVVSDFGIEKRVHADQMPIENHVYDERSNTLQLYWKKGVDVIKFLAENSGDSHLQRVKETAEQHARLMESSTQHTQAESALFDDDEEEGQVPEVAPTTSKSTQQLKSSKRSAPIFEATEETSAGHCVQTIKELQTIPVIISSDLTVSPPVIKCFAVNPFN